MNKLLQAYLTIVATFIMLFIAAILIAVIYVGVQLSQKISAVEAKANDAASKIDSFNKSVENLNTNIKKINPFN